MKLKQSILLFLVVIVIIFISVNLSTDKRDLAGDFSATEIRQIKIGMNLNEVLETLGRPYQITSFAGNPGLKVDVNPETDIRLIVNQKFSETDFCCEGNKRNVVYKRVTLVYTKRKKFSRHYPMLWVHLDSNCLVASVFAKQYEGYLRFDDPCIYSLDAGRNFENTKLFEKNFN